MLRGPPTVRHEATEPSPVFVIEVSSDEESSLSVALHLEQADSTDEQCGPGHRFAGDDVAANADARPHRFSVGPRQPLLESADE